MHLYSFYTQFEDFRVFLNNLRVFLKCRKTNDGGRWPTAAAVEAAGAGRRCPRGRDRAGRVAAGRREWWARMVGAGWRKSLLKV